MKQSVFILSFCIGALASIAQLPSKDEKAFINALNKLVITTRQQHFFTDAPLSVDSVFHLLNDSLTLTVMYEYEGSKYRLRYAVPFREIKALVYDHYLSLQYGDKKVNVYEQKNQGNWQLIEQNHLFYLAVVNDDNKKERKMKEEIETAFERLKH